MMFVKPATATDTIIMPYFEHHPAWSSYDAITGMTYSRAQNSNHIGGGRAQQGGTPAIGDDLSWYVSLDSGTYTLTVMATSNNNRAIIDLTLDGSSIGSYDAYSASLNHNAIATFTGIVVSTPGNYLLKMDVSGKNASSNNYYFPGNWFSFIRTGA